jgi:DHA1 family tetracycline resistance protein-like MFS transporter
MLTLFIIVFVDLVGFGLMVPLLPFYGEHFQASPFAVGLLMATYSIAQFITAPVLGRLSDHHGRRPVLLLSLAGSVASYLWLASAESLWMLFAARTLAGAMAGNIATAFAYVADITTPQTRAKGMGIIGASFGLGFIFGPALGGLLAGDDPNMANYALPALAAAALSATAFVLAVFRLPESLPASVRAERAGRPRQSRWLELQAALGKPAIARLIALAFLSTFVFAGMETIFAMWSRRAYGWGPEQNGYIFALVGLVSAAVQAGLVGWLTRFTGERQLIIAGALALTLGMAVIPLVTDVIVLVIAMVVVAGGFALMSPALNSLLSLQASASEQGMMMGVTRSAMTLARIVGPVAAGWIFAELGKDSPFFAGAMMMALVAWLAARWLPTARRLSE